MLRLYPGDNMSQRTWLGSMLISVCRPADALSFARIWLDSEGQILPRGGTIFTPPSNEPLPAQIEEKLSQFSIGALAYTAALASHQLWGNCPIANQYLRIAARVNSTVFMRILGNVQQPSMIGFLAFCAYVLY
jgi:hypothetical protein